MKYFERIRIARWGSEGLVRNDVACNIYARLDHHLEGPFDDALRFPTGLILLDGNTCVFLHLPYILIKLGQFSEDKRLVYHEKISF